MRVEVQGWRASSWEAQETQSKVWICGPSQRNMSYMTVSRSRLRTPSWENIDVINKKKKNWIWDKSSVYNVLNFSRLDV